MEVSRMSFKQGEEVYAGYYIHPALYRKALGVYVCEYGGQHVVEVDGELIRTKITETAWNTVLASGFPDVDASKKIVITYKNGTITSGIAGRFDWDDSNIIGWRKPND
jgi:hypothetical protein